MNDGCRGLCDDLHFAGWLSQRIDSSFCEAVRPELGAPLVSSDALEDEDVLFGGITEIAGAAGARIRRNWRRLLRPSHLAHVERPGFQCSQWQPALFAAADDAQAQPTGAIVRHFRIR